MTKQTKIITAAIIVVLISLIVIIFYTKNNGKADSHQVTHAVSSEATSSKEEPANEMEVVSETSSATKKGAAKEKEATSATNKENKNNAKKEAETGTSVRSQKILKYTTEKTTEKTTVKVTEKTTEKIASNTTVPKAIAKTSSPSAIEKEVLDKVNAYRKENGLNELAWDNTIHAVAEIRAEECAVSFSHTRPDGTKCGQLLTDFGLYTRYGENLYKFTIKGTTSDTIVKDFQNSSGHNEIMLRSYFTRAGFAYYENPATGYCYFVQIFSN